MSKKEQSSFSSVVSVNPYTNTYVNAISSFLSKVDSIEYAKGQYTISYLNTRSFINSQLSVSKNIPDEDLYDAIFTKVYDELGLDQAVEYHIQYIETFNNLDEDNRNFHVFIVDPIVHDVFKEPVEKIKYIDRIIPSPLLFKSLYTKELIEDNGVHCFIYFQENDAFITIYNEKEFIYTKSISYSFKEMHTRFCELYGEQIEYDDFIDFVANENLKTTTSNYKEHLIKLYKEIFANINDILTYVKRALDIEKIEMVYVDTQLDTISKLHEMAEVELSIKSSDYNFDYGFETDGYIDQMHLLMHLFRTIPKDERYECNFTTYYRPPKFIKRHSGRLILLAVASLVIAFIYPVSYWTLTYAQELQYTLLEEEYNEVHNIKTTREATIKNREADRTKTKTLLEHEKNDYIEKKNTLIKIHDVKVNYPMKASLLYKLTKDLNRYKVRLETIAYDEDLKDNPGKHMTFGLVSSRDKKITDLLKYLTKTYEGKFHFSLDEIQYDVENKLYFSELKVTLL
jgi:hypothetical protein